MIALKDHQDEHGILAFLRAHPQRSFSAYRIARELGISCQQVAHFLRRSHGPVTVAAQNKHKKYYKWRTTPSIPADPGDEP